MSSKEILVVIIFALGAFLLLPLIKFVIDICISISENGVLWHKGFRLYNQNLILLILDMRKNPANYSIDRWVLSSKLICVWICNDWSFYKDYGDPPVRLGKLSVADRFLLRKELGNFSKPKYLSIKTSSLDFEIALRKQNGMIA